MRGRRRGRNMCGRRLGRIICKIRGGDGGVRYLVGVDGVEVTLLLLLAGVCVRKITPRAI